MCYITVQHSYIQVNYKTNCLQHVTIDGYRSVALSMLQLAEDMGTKSLTIFVRYGNIFCHIMIILYNMVVDGITMILSLDQCDNF